MYDNVVTNTLHRQCGRGRDSRRKRNTKRKKQEKAIKVLKSYSKGNGIRRECFEKDIREKNVNTDVYLTER